MQKYIVSVLVKNHAGVLARVASLFGRRAFNLDSPTVSTTTAPTISRMSNAVIVAHLRIDMEDRGGKIDLMIPYATLEPVRELLLQMFMGERFGRDTIWENHLMSQLWETEVEIKAVLKETDIRLGEISAWEKGSFLPLDITASDPVNIVCGDVNLLKGSMGRKEEHIVIRIDGKAEKDA